MHLIGQISPRILSSTNRSRRHSRTQRALRSAVRSTLEALEPRMLLTTSTFTPLDNLFPSPQVINGNQMMLLSDGSVLAEMGNESSGWYKLTPDSNGNYQHGTWSTTPSMMNE